MRIDTAAELTVGLHHRRVDGHVKPMLLLIAIVVIGSFAALAFQYWNQLHGPESSLEPVPFSRWIWVGMIIPSLGWLILNTGLLPALPPLMPAIAMAQSAGRSWMPL